MKFVLALKTPDNHRKLAAHNCGVRKVRDRAPLLLDLCLFSFRTPEGVKDTLTVVHFAHFACRSAR